MRELTYAEALNEALHQSMARDQTIVVWGQAVGCCSGTIAVNRGLYESFGPLRVGDAPGAESGVVGAAIGAAMAGLKPVVELMGVDFASRSLDQIFEQAARMHKLTGGALKVPVVIRTLLDDYSGVGALHWAALHDRFARVPGLKVVLPSNPFDAKGLLIAALESADPVVFIEHQRLYRSARGPVPAEYYTIPFGQAVVRRRGRDVTLIAFSRMNQLVLQAAELLARDGIDAEVIDPRTLVPVDTATLLASVRKTGRVLLVGEDHGKGVATRDLADHLAEWAGADLLVAPRYLVPPDEPVLFDQWLPAAQRVASSARELLACG